MKKYFLFFIVLLSSCRHNNSLDEQLNNIMNKEIFFDETISSSNEQFTVVHYIDSIGCIPCKLRPYDWIAFQKRIDSVYNKKVNIKFVSHLNAVKDLKKLMIAKEMINIELIPDTANRWLNSNQIGNNKLFYTLLLDSNNRVLIVGEPFLNDKMRTLYDNAIMQDKK